MHQIKADKTLLCYIRDRWGFDGLRPRYGIAEGRGEAYGKRVRVAYSYELSRVSVYHPKDGVSVYYPKDGEGGTSIRHVHITLSREVFNTEFDVVFTPAEIIEILYPS